MLVHVAAWSDLRAAALGGLQVTTTLSVYAHLFEYDLADAMFALAAMSTPATGENVVRLQNLRRQV